MNSKLFAVCVILLVASVISLSEANVIDTQFDGQLGKKIKNFPFVCQICAKSGIF